MSLPWCITFLAILCAFYILFFVLFNFYDPTNFFSLLFSSNMLLFSYVRLQKPEPLVFPVKLFYKAYVRLLKSPTTMLMSYIFYLVFFMVFDAIKFECKHICSSISAYVCLFVKYKPLSSEHPTLEGQTSRNKTKTSWPWNGGLRTAPRRIEIPPRS